MAKKGYHDDASIAAAQKKTATDSVSLDDKTMDSLKMNLILSQVLNIQGTPATIIGDQMVAGAIPADELEGLVKSSWRKPVASKLRRWLRELAVWLLIGAAVGGGGLFSPARAAAKRQRHIAAHPRRQGGGSERHEPAKAAAAVRLGHGAGSVATPRRRWYRLPPMAAMC